MSVDERRRRFTLLHEEPRLFLMPNPWDVGSARLLGSLGFEAIATTSAGLAWSLGKLDQNVARDELVGHVKLLAAATPLPLNVDSERCYPEAPGGVGETVAMLADAGAAGFSVEDFDPSSGRVDDIAIAAERVAVAAEAAHDLAGPMTLTGRAENYIRGVNDLDDTLRRLIAYREAGADVLYAPGLVSIDDIARIVESLQSPVNVLLLPGGPSVADLAAVGVRRVSTGGTLALHSYSLLASEARALLATGAYLPAADQLVSRETLTAAFATDRNDPSS